MSAQTGPTYGLGASWTHTTDMSSDGYLYPDSGSHCYLGFDGASPTLTGSSFEWYAGVYGKDFITSFYDYALNQYSVNDALDRASSDRFQCDYRNSPLFCGYWTWWPIDFGPGMGPGWYNGHMHVYGNGMLYLATDHQVTVSAKDQYGNDLTGKDVYINGHWRGVTGSAFSMARATIFVSDFWEPNWIRYTFQNYTWGSPPQSTTDRTLQWQFTSDATVTAYFSSTYCPGDVDGNGQANINDWNAFVPHYPSCRGGGANWDSRCDFDADGDVDINDLHSLGGLLLTATAT